MTEYIFQIDNVTAGDSITISNAPTGLAVKNFLAIINKTTGKPVHSPIAECISSVSYSGTTLTLTLSSGHPTIAGNLLIKAYADTAGSYDQLVADFFNITEATEYEAAPDSEILNELDDLWTEITGQPVPSSGGSSSN